jgi:hypothetical protein
MKRESESNAGDGPFRQLSGEERAIIERLLEQPFDGADAIRGQLDGATVRPWDCDDDDNCGSIVFAGGDWGKAKPIGNTGQGFVDGVPVEAMLFVHDDGRLALLELVVYGDRIPRLPRPEELVVKRDEE